MCEEQVPVDEAFSDLIEHWNKEDCMDVIREYIEDDEKFRQFLKDNLTDEQKWDICWDVYHGKTDKQEVKK
jgi:hypothetical protein